jgi:predicted nucleic acid-binding protein
LRATVDNAIALFGPLCVSFDALAAYEFARIIAARRRIGRPIEELDAQIAAIPKSGGFTLATLNKEDFADIEGLKLIDPSA